MDSSTAAASDGDGGSSSSLNVEHDTAAKTTGLDEFLLLLSVRVPNQTDVARIAGAMDKVTKTPPTPPKKWGLLLINNHTPEQHQAREPGLAVGAEHPRGDNVQPHRGRRSHAHDSRLLFWRRALGHVGGAERRAACRTRRPIRAAAGTTSVQTATTKSNYRYVRVRVCVCVCAIESVVPS